MDYKLTKGTGETYLINHNQHSWGLFFINEHGDLFLESDWGYWTFSWRAFNGSFKGFLVRIDDDYFFGKLLINHNQWGKGRSKVQKNTENAVKGLFGSLKEILKSELTPELV